MGLAFERVLDDVDRENSKPLDERPGHSDDTAATLRFSERVQSFVSPGSGSDHPYRTANRIPGPLTKTASRRGAIGQSRPRTHIDVTVRS